MKEHQEETKKSQGLSGAIVIVVVIICLGLIILQLLSSIHNSRVI